MLPSSLAFNMVQMGANTYQKLHFRLLNSPLNPSDKKKTETCHRDFSGCWCNNLVLTILKNDGVRQLG
jgi:hypothetical protein